MLTVADFISQYENYNDEKLFEVHNNRENYSSEAAIALDSVIAKKGGMDGLLKRLERKKMEGNEINRLTREINSLKSKETNADFVKTMVSSPTLPKGKVDELIDDIFAKYEAQLKDEAINPRTIVGSLVGGGLAALVGGILWGLQLMYGGRGLPIKITVILAIGLVLLCYGIIRLFTRQSWNNIVVVLASIFSFGLAITFGMLLFRWFGYLG